MRPSDVVFLFDVDNTLLDYEIADLRKATPGAADPHARGSDGASHSALSRTWIPTS